MTEECFEQPDGSMIDYVLWRSTKAPSMIFAVTDHNTVILVRQFCYAAERFLIEVPGGQPKENESREQVAIDELEEETGYQAEAIIPLGEAWFEPRNLAVPYVSFLAFGCKKVKSPNLDKTEILEVIELELAEWVRLFINGTIPRDSKSGAITLLALPHLGFKLYAPDGQNVW